MPHPLLVFLPFLMPLFVWSPSPLPPPLSPSSPRCWRRRRRSWHTLLETLVACQRIFAHSRCLIFSSAVDAADVGNTHAESSSSNNNNRSSSCLQRTHVADRTQAQSLSLSSSLWKWSRVRYVTDTPSSTRWLSHIRALYCALWLRCALSLCLYCALLLNCALLLDCALLLYLRSLTWRALSIVNRMLLVLRQHLSGADVLRVVQTLFTSIL